MFVVTCDGVFIIRIDVGCVADNVRVILFGSINFEFIALGDMLSERTFAFIDAVSTIGGGGFELNELRLRLYNGIVPFGTGAVDTN